MHKDKRNKLIIIFVYSIVTFLFVGVFTFSKLFGAQGIWVSMDERKKIWDDVAGKNNYQVSKDGLEATFYQDGASWTIIGANAPIVNPTIYPKDWPVKGDNFEIEVVTDPIKNYKILPFTEKIENATYADTITVTIAQDSYEPASFVIRSGDQDLKDMMVEVSDIKAEIKDKHGKIRKAVISKDNIDVRIVKCWYQAGIYLTDVRHKKLVPELLLHDNNLVHVDYGNQVNLIRNLDRIEDADTLKPFSLARRRNQQVWLTIHVKAGTEPGFYEGKIRVFNHQFKKELQLTLEVLPFTLPEPMLFYGLYYNGKLTNSKDTSVRSEYVNIKRMKEELIDMREHGLENATLCHIVNEDKSKWNENWEILQKTINLRKEIGWKDKPLLYLDWGYSLIKDSRLYEEKVRKIIEISKKSGIKDVYVYGVEEKGGSELYELDKNLYKRIHEIGAKTFVAGEIDQFLKYDSNIDLLVIWGQNLFYPIKKISEAKKQNKIVYFYDNPQAGMEQPETYRINEGFKLFATGADGVLDFSYQAGVNWNDFANKVYRSYNMTYSTLDKPISTIQWEGWREGVNDIRYLTLLHKQGIGIKELKDLITSINDSDETRQIVINKIMTKQ